MPVVVRETSLPLPLLRRGKVRDTYELGPGLLLMVATDRISAFDVVLPTPIPEKGVVLNRLSAFWFRRTAHLVPNHFVALADEPDALTGLVPPEVRSAIPPEVARRGMVVKRARRIDVECIARGYITGSAWAEYRRQGTVHGQRMPPSLREGDPFPEPLFTPTTKAEEGHDRPLSWQELVDLVGEELAKALREKTLEVYRFAHAYARERGILIADTKLEFGLLAGELIVIDELLTPDSSRFWDAQAWAPGQSLPNYDKQFVRDYLTQMGWNREPPAPELPPEIVEKTRERYRTVYRMLTGDDLG